MTNGLVSNLRREFTTLRAALRSLDGTLQRITAAHGLAKIAPRSRARYSAKARASMVLQGRYMGYMRQLKPRQKAQVRGIKETKGVRAAISRAKSLTRS